MIRSNSFQLFSIVLSLVLLSCGGGGSESASPLPTPTPPSTPQPTVLTGVFIDSAVEGLAFQTPTQSGMTDENGSFMYVEGEMVTFSIGDLTFPEVTGKASINPLDVFQVSTMEDARVINLARLLQTLDEDGMPGNGIKISEMAHTQASGLSVDFADADFESQVNALVANSGAVYTNLVSELSAKNHLSLSLGNEENKRQCDVSTSKTGYVGEFSNLAHDVSGKAEVLDGCTIEITMFNFDGQAPNVRFYSGNNLMFTGDNAVALSDRIDGRPFDNETVVLRLPEGVSLDDFDSISVWCVEFAVDFGSLILEAP